MYKQYLALNNLRGLICYKTQLTNQVYSVEPCTKNVNMKTKLKQFLRHKVILDGLTC